MAVKSRPLIGIAIATVLVVIASSAMYLISPRVRHAVKHRLTYDSIGAPDVTWTVPVVEPVVPAPDVEPVVPVPDVELVVPVPVRLAVAGDVGTGGADEIRIAAAMDAMEAQSEYDALILLGDNVYPNGDPVKLPEVVFGPFDPVLDNGTQLLPVLGNHDVRDGHGDAQAAALGMPGRWYATRIGDVLIVSLDSTRPDDPDQLAWLESTLSESGATWAIATMHHPPYSGGMHGSSLDVREAFTPLLEKYGVQLALAGHDHDYQRSKPINCVTYVVSGGAAKLRPANRADFTAVAWSTYHFLDLLVWPDRLEVRAINQDGAMFDSVTLQP